MKSVRSAELSDLETIMGIYENARSIMRASGNMNQWINGYPGRELVEEDIARRQSYVIVEDEVILGVFVFIIGKDPTYAEIYEGAWLDDEPYGVIHRMGSSGRASGVASCCFDWCFSQIRNIRVDTHRDNSIMHSFLKSYGFERCGIIYIADGSERIAYQKHLK